ncbi:vesicle transport protein [Spinellus fusiger]|nr:vesicle transport protein [Spinellus fusiger]
MASMDEINLHRLLVSCEEKTRQQDMDLWTGSEKIKFSTYVEYLEQLVTKLNSSQSYANASERIKALTQLVTLHAMVEKGIIEARATKKLHLEDLQRYETPQPEWLLTVQEDIEREESAWEESQVLTKEKVEEQEEEEEISEKPQTLRKRQGPTETREKEAYSAEHVLQHHREMQAELTTDLSRMAQQLKMNSQSFGDILAKDTLVLTEAQKAVQDNLERMQKERKRLDSHYTKSWGTSFMTFGTVLFVCIVFILVFFTIRFLPKVT